MSAALLRLERFDEPRPPVPVARFGPQDLQAAFERGMQQGRDEARDEQAGRLCRELAGLQAALTDQAADQTLQHARALAAMRPLLEALFEGILPPVAQGRLCSALLTELERLAGTVTPACGRIRCAPELAPFVATCMALTGLDRLELEDGAPAGTVELSVLGGTIALDRGAVTDSLRALVNEFLEDA